MSNIMQVYDYTPELLEGILANITGQAEKDVTEQIIKRFADAKLPIKVKHIYYDKPWAYYRVLCYIKKSAEAVIINTKNDLGKGGVAEEMNVQIRIANTATLNRLDALCENVRNQIMNANDCASCSDKCKKQYVFSYQGTSYNKCQFLCSNFRFINIVDSDVTSIVSIVDGELSKKK